MVEHKNTAFFAARKYFKACSGDEEFLTMPPQSTRGARKSLCGIETAARYQPFK